MVVFIAGGVAGLCLQRQFPDRNARIQIKRSDGDGGSPAYQLVNLYRAIYRVRAELFIQSRRATGRSRGPAQDRPDEGHHHRSSSSARTRSTRVRCCSGRCQTHGIGDHAAARGGNYDPRIADLAMIAGCGHSRKRWTTSACGSAAAASTTRTAWSRTEAACGSLSARRTPPGTADWQLRVKAGRNARSDTATERNTRHDI